MKKSRGFKLSQKDYINVDENNNPMIKLSKDCEKIKN